MVWRQPFFGSFIRAGDQFNIGSARVDVPDGRLFLTPGLRSQSVRTQLGLSAAGASANFTFTSVRGRFAAEDPVLNVPFGVFFPGFTTFAPTHLLDRSMPSRS